jgi:Tfp pilus assembly protein PilF/4-amino-4-deoxy-L-arabinose transferase-like glycosyltransferase
MEKRSICVLQPDSDQNMEQSRNLEKTISPAGEHAKYSAIMIWVPVSLSLLLSFVHIFFLQANPTYDLPIIDSLEYVKRAEYILTPPMTPRPFLHSPFYAWFLAGVFFYFGKSLTLIRVMQAILNCISCILVYQLGRRCFAPVVGRYAALGYALYAPVIYFATEIINVPFVLFFTLFSLFLLIRLVEEMHWKWWLTAGLFAGLNLMTRADTFVFYLVAMALITWKKPTAFLRSTGFVIFMLVPILLTGMYNLYTFGRFQVLPANSGIAFYVGNNPDYMDTIGIRPGVSYQNLIEKPNRDGIVPTKEDYAFNQYFYGRSFEFMVHQPVQYLQCLIYKIRTLIGGYELPETYDLYTFRKYSPVLKLLLFYWNGFGFPFSILFPLSIMGIIIGLRQSGSQRLLMLFLACMLFPLLGYWNSTRYRMTIIPILLLYSGVSIVWIRVQIQRKEIRKVSIFVLFFCVLLTVASLPYPHFSKGHDFDAEMYISAGLSSLSKRNTKEGIGLLQKGVMLEPDNFYYRGQLAHAFQKKDFFQEALQEYQKALQLNSKDITLHNNIGALYDQLKKEEMALHHYRKAVSLNPNFSISRHNLGALLFRQQQYKEASEHLKTAVTFSPDFSASHYLLGMSLLKLGQNEQGMKEIAEAIRLNPGLKKM